MDVDFVMGEIVPDENPSDADGNVEDYHGMNAVWGSQEGCDKLDETEDDGTPHVSGRMASGDDEVAEKSGNRCKGTSNAQHLHHNGTFEPFVCQQNDNKLFGYQSQTEHGGEGGEGCEAEEFAEDTFLSHWVTVCLGKDWLGNASNHAVDKRTAHVVPLVGLCKVTYLMGGVEFT